MTDLDKEFMIKAICCTPLHFAHIFIQKKDFPFDALSQDDWEIWQREMVSHSMEYLPKGRNGAIENDADCFGALCNIVTLLSDVLLKKGFILTNFTHDQLQSMWNKCLFEARIAQEASRIPGMLKESLSEEEKPI